MPMSIMHSEVIVHFRRKRHYSFGALYLYLTFAVTLRQVKKDLIKQLSSLTQFD